MWLSRRLEERTGFNSWPRHTHLLRSFVYGSGAQGVLPSKGVGVVVTDSQLNLPSLIPLSIAGWGQLQCRLGYFSSISANSC